MKKPKDYVQVNLLKGTDNWQEICFSEMSKQQVLKLKRAVNKYTKYWWDK